VSYAKLKYAWKSYGFCSEHGLGSCECLQRKDRELSELSGKAYRQFFLREFAMKSAWWNDPLSWVVE